MRSQSEYGFFYQPKIMSGVAAMENIPVELDGFNARHPFVITSKGISSSGLAKKFVKALYDSNTIVGALYDDVPAYASIGLIRELAQFYRDRGCDSIIAIGTGSVVDAAKGINIIVSTGKDVLEFEENNAVLGHLKPFVVVPTATIAPFDLTGCASIEGREIISDYLFPDIIAIDTRMIRGCCSDCMRATALVSLTQALEAFLSPQANHLTDAYASMALRIITEHIVKAVKQPRNKKTCLAMANAATASAAAFHNQLPVPVHSLGMALSKLTGHLPGLCMGALLPAALKLRGKKKESFRSDLLLSIGGADRYAESAENDRANKGEAALMNLIASIPGIPQGLSSLKVSRHIAEEAIALVAKKEPALKKQDLEEIISMAL